MRTCTKQMQGFVDGYLYKESFAFPWARASDVEADTDVWTEYGDRIRKATQLKPGRIYMGSRSVAVGDTKGPGSGVQMGRHQFVFGVPRNPAKFKGYTTLVGDTPVVLLSAHETPDAQRGFSVLQGRVNDKVDVGTLKAYLTGDPEDVYSKMLPDVFELTPDKDPDTILADMLKQMGNYQRNTRKTPIKYVWHKAAFGGVNSNAFANTLAQRAKAIKGPLDVRGWNPAYAKKIPDIFFDNPESFDISKARVPDLNIEQQWNL